MTCDWQSHSNYSSFRSYTHQCWPLHSILLINKLKKKCVSEFVIFFLWTTYFLKNKRKNVAAFLRVLFQTGIITGVLFPFIKIWSKDSMFQDFCDAISNWLMVKRFGIISVIRNWFSLWRHSCWLEYSRPLGRVMAARMTSLFVDSDTRKLLCMSSWFKSSSLSLTNTT